MVVKRYSLDKVRNEALELEVIQQRIRPDNSIVICGGALVSYVIPNTVFDPLTGAFMGVQSHYAQ